MEMELVVPVPPVDFDFDSTCSSPYMTAPSSPQRFGNFFFSAPTSPSRASAFYRDFNSFSVQDMMPRKSVSSIPFNWEENPGIPKSKAANDGENNNDDNDENEDFEFNFSGQLQRTSLSADELFDGGKIKPLKPPPRLQVVNGANDSVSYVSSPRSPRSPRTPISKISLGRKMVQEALSPRHKRDFDPFAAAIEETRRQGDLDQQQGREHEQKRGRERVSSGTSSSSFLRKGTRSVSPLRVSDIVFEGEENPQAAKITSSTPSNPKSSTSSSSSSTHSSFLSSLSFSKGYRKWRLRDFLLFRSASEGRATGKDPLTKFALLSKTKVAEDVKNSSFRSTDSVGSVSSSRRRLPVSAHEFHYTVNRAVSEEMRKKTFLPYKQGLLGCLGFNPAVHEISKGLGSVTRG